MQRPRNPKIGVDRFVLKEEYGLFNKGDVVVLCDDDGTINPWFCKPDNFKKGEKKNCVGDFSEEGGYYSVIWSELEPENTLDEGKQRLNEMPNTGVHCRTQEEYNELMQIFEDAGWGWIDGESPTEKNYWGVYENKTYVDAHNGFVYGRVDSTGRNRTIITLDGFKREQGLVGQQDLIQHHLVRNGWAYGYTGARVEWRVNKEVESNRKGLMQKLTARLKKALNSNLQAFYKLGWINGDLEVTDLGRREAMEWLYDNFEKELGAIAKERVKEQEDEE